MTSYRVMIMSAAVLLASACNSLPTPRQTLACPNGFVVDDDQFPAQFSDSQHQSVHWVKDSDDLLYVVDVTPIQSNRVGVRLAVQNNGPEAVYLLTNQDWLLHYGDEKLNLVLGEAIGNYGNEVPALTKILPGQCIAQADWVTLPHDHDQKIIHNLQVSFFVVLGTDSATANHLMNLQEVNGWWQIEGDLELNERYYRVLRYIYTAFPILD